MFWHTTVAGAVLLSLCRRAVALAAIPGINWFACSQNASIATTCGTLEVPLDYTDASSNQTLTLQLVKINATTQPSKGSVLFDFGGPGNINLDYFSGTDGEALLLLTGGVHDLITFEPRGTGITLPYSCYNSSGARERAMAASPLALNGSTTVLEQAWEAAGELAETCFGNAKSFGELVGTSFVARDMMQIVDALDEDGMLRYYGISYGTTLGATTAAMFPDRIDRMVLDGVENPTDYWAGPLFSLVLDTDAAFSAFFTACIESPSLCPVAQNDSSAGSLERRVTTLLEELKSEPLLLESSNSTATITYGSLKQNINNALYFPAEWPNLAIALQAIFDRNLTAYAAITGAIGVPDPGLFLDLAGPEVTDGIECADSSLRAENLTDLLPNLTRFEAESWIRGDTDPPLTMLQCARWKFASKERYRGGFDNVRTKNPALIVGNSIDPATPLASARNLSEGLKGSVLLQNNGYGHTTIASPSLCTAKYIRAYFVNGTLPPVGTVCESITSTQPFAFDGSYYEVISSLGNETVTKRDTGALSVRNDDDDALLKAVRDLGKSFAMGKMRRGR